MTSGMEETPDVRELQMRIVELENKLAQMSQSGQAVNVTPEELQAYQKVRDMLAIDPACGINECSRCIVNCYRCTLCYTCYLCYRCIFECTCGPCNVGNIGSGPMGGGGRFGGLGG